jgi:saposin
VSEHAEENRDLSNEDGRIMNGAECSLCKYVLSYINVLLTSNSTEEEVARALESVCLILPAQYHSQCANFVHQYGPLLPQLVAELDDPNVVCEWLTMCTKSDVRFIDIPSLKRVSNSLTCNLCQYVVNYLDAVIQSNSTETQLQVFLENVCQILPSETLQTQCDSLVDSYGKLIIQYLIEHADPQTVCQAIGICDK